MRPCECGEKLECKPAKRKNDETVWYCIKCFRCYNDDGNQIGCWAWEQTGDRWGPTIWHPWTKEYQRRLESYMARSLEENER